jgi:hypothetical protein
VCCSFFKKESKTYTWDGILFFLKKEPKTLALRGYALSINHRSSEYAMKQRVYDGRLVTFILRESVLFLKKNQNH